MVIFMAKYGKYIIDEINHYMKQEDLINRINLSESIKKKPSTSKQSISDTSKKEESKPEPENKD